MYRVRENHGVLATPWGNWQEGEAFTQNPEHPVPKDTVAAWLEAGVLVADESGPDVAEILDETDILTPLDRKSLLRLIVANPDVKKVVKPFTSWTPDMIRQAIRDCVPDLSTLTIPAAEDQSSL